MTVYPAKADFCRLAQEYTILPVSIELSTDTETPVSLYYKLVGENPGFILESAETSKTIGRYSFIGTKPFATFTGYSEHSEIMVAGNTCNQTGEPVIILKSFLQKFSLPDLPDLPLFAGGAVGYFAYEAVATWERVRGLNVPEDMALLELMVCQHIIVMDHLTHSTKLLYLTYITAGANVATEYEQAVDELHKLIAKIRQPAILPEICEDSQCEQTPSLMPSEDSEIKQKYIEMVKQAKEYIAAGDIFQVVLSRSFTHKLKSQPFALYRRLRQANPSPYMFYINLGTKQLVGASPERLVKLEGDKVLTCPIAGTRRRGSTPAEDEQLAKELLADTKELAEHAMLVDLGRNDLGRISLPGTVNVDRMMVVEKFSHVMHIVSEVSGQFDPQFSPVDVLTACFPAGTLSGAPKVRAMEIINELEGDIRGSYAGAVGYLDFRGNIDTCITIRTMAIDNGQITIRAGAGIVADSIPETEYQEVLNKAAVLLKLAAEGGSYDYNY